MARLSVIEGIGDTYEDKLKGMGIPSVEAFLQACKTKKERIQLAERAGISERLILKWANHADLMRIKGIGGDYAELLEASGVDTVPELATRKPDNLYKKMKEINFEKTLVKKLPSESQVMDWIKQASKLPRVLEY